MFVGAILDHLDTDIGTSGNDVLGPSSAGKALLGVLEPNEFTTTDGSVGAGSKEIESAVTVEVKPLTHMVEVSIKFSADLGNEFSLGDIVIGHSHNVKTTVGVAGDQETIGHDDCSEAKDLLRDDLDIVGPLELETVSIKLDGFKSADISGLDSLGNVGHNVDGAITESLEGRAEEELLRVAELGDVGEGSLVKLEVSNRFPSDIGSGKSDGSNHAGNH